MSQEIFQVDAFADRPFTGNPAAVCLLSADRDAAWMQQVAMEMHLSETAFLVRRDDGSFDLRWFTPTVEVDLCGHATLASAHILWEAGHLAPGDVARFHTRSGELRAERGDDGWIRLDFPSRQAEEVVPPDGLFAALGIERGGLEAEWSGRNRDDYLIVLSSPSVLRGLRPDMGALAKVRSRGVIVTCAADPQETPGIDFLSRFFGPAVGVPEDPVTGSAHCCLAPYWGERLGKKEMIGYQASDRGGTVRVCPKGERVELHGRAVTVLRGELFTAGATDRSED